MRGVCLGGRCGRKGLLCLGGRVVALHLGGMGGGMGMFYFNGRGGRKVWGVGWQRGRVGVGGREMLELFGEGKPPLFGEAREQREFASDAEGGAWIIFGAFGELDRQAQENNEVLVFVLEGEVALMKAAELFGEGKGQTGNKDGLGLLFKGFEKALEVSVFEEDMGVFKAHLERRRRGRLIALKGELDAPL